MDESKGLGKMIENISKNKKAVSLIVILGILGIVLILVSEFFSFDSTPKTDISDSPLQFSQEEYTAALEERILKLISSIDGVGEAKVMVTMKTTVSYVYATERSLTEDSTEEISGDESGRTDFHQSIDESYVYIESDNGRKQALLLTEILPEVKGVVVVCEGGDTLAVRNDVINAVTTGLGIYSNNVYVTKLSE